MLVSVELLFFSSHPLTSPFPVHLSWSLSQVFPLSLSLWSHVFLQHQSFLVSNCPVGLVSKPQVSIYLSPCTCAGTERSTMGQGAECDSWATPCSGVTSSLRVSSPFPPLIPADELGPWASHAFGGQLDAATSDCMSELPFTMEGLTYAWFLLPRTSSDQSYQKMPKSKKAILGTLSLTFGLRPHKCWWRAEAEVRIYTLGIWRRDTEIICR